jgi:trigger factor
MNVEVENLPNCLATLHVELPPEQVTKKWNEVAQNFRQVVRVPGFRPGKAPQSVVEAKFRKEIQEELTRKLIGETTREAIREKGLKVLSISEVEDVEFTPERSMRFTATLVTSPEFELPEYHHIPVEQPVTTVAEQEVEDALRSLRERYATFTDITGRGLLTGDFAVIDYSTSLDGRPVSEVVPQAPKTLIGKDDFWIKVEGQMLLDGFIENLLGMETGQTRTFQLAIPKDFPVTELAERSLEFSVVLKAIKEIHLPEADDALAAQIVPGLDLEKLNEMLRKQLESEKLRQAETSKRNQIVDYLVSRVECELPQSYVKSETRRIMSDIVQHNQLRGVPDEALRENQRDIVSAASRNAKDRLKANFILNRIAEREGIEVGKKELQDKIRSLAEQHRITYEKAVSDLESRGALGSLQEELLIGKVLDFLTSDATIKPSSEEAVPR